ncbi:MAG: DNA-directed RNA polymerase subunit beta', partial [Candidatus Firestonebacteria bacterium]
MKNAKLIEAEVEKRLDFNSILVKLASPETIRKWSHGEVKKPETINYRTFRPEKDGLFDEKIFGPTKDWECYCGKYKRIKYREIVCERCGVQVTSSKVRRERMGHIELASPVTHIWFLKSIPSRIGILLDMPTKELERVIYYESYVVIDPGTTDLPKKQLLSEEDLQKCKSKYGAASFKYKIGADAVRVLLEEIKLEELSKQLKDDIKGTDSVNKKKDLIKRLRIVENFRKSGNHPDWMVLDALPV